MSSLPTAPALPSALAALGRRSELDVPWCRNPVGVFFSLLTSFLRYSSLAQDLNLNRWRTVTPLNEHHARLLNNRTRVWINCFNLDRSTGAQYGKAPIIPNSDYIANHLHDWWSSPYNIEHFDIHICVYSMELNIVARFMEKVRNNPNHPTELNMVCFRLCAREPLVPS